MSSGKRWRQLGGGSFYKFDQPGQTLEGIWQGTQAGKFGDNGRVETADGELHLFSLNTALRDLIRVKAGAEVKIEYLGKQRAKNGNEFKAFRVFVQDDAEVEDPDEPRDSEPVPF